MKKTKKRISIRHELLAVMLCVVILQGFLCFSALIFNGGFNYLKNNAEATFANITAAKKNNLESFMVNGGSYLSESQKEIQSMISQGLAARERSVSDLAWDKELNRELLSEVTDHMMDILRYNSATESYIVLQGYGESGERQHCGIQIRNLDKEKNAASKGFLLETGDSEIAKAHGLALDSNWQSRFVIDEGQMDTSWYQKPIEAAQTYPNKNPADLGYWSDSYQWQPEDIRVISYSLPLVQDGQVYGVLGITVSEEYMESLLPFKELDVGQRGSFVLATTTDEKEYQSVFSSGIVSNDLAGNGDVLAFPKEPITGKPYQLTGQNTYGNVQYIDLYRKASPFSGTKWALIGVLPRTVLFDASHRLWMTVIIAFVVSIVLGVLAALIGSYFFTRPITRMAETIKKKSGRAVLEFKPSNVSEIDALGSAIMTLNANVRETASKVTQIIELVDLPLGVIEYRAYSDKIFCTEKVVTMLRMDEQYYSSGLLDRLYFEEYFEEAGLSDLLYMAADKDYQIEKGGVQEWVHFQSMADEDKALITVLDVTKDVYERQKIEYERDYDILTHLLNRRAFKRRVSGLLEDCNQENLGAMIMWDLDNLKYVNDTFGHDYGDHYIQQAGKIFGGLVKEGGVVGRMSGDEFLAFVPRCGTKERMLDMMEEIKGRLNATRVIMSDGSAVAIRASGGIAWYPKDGMTYEELKKHADFAMYDTKNSYKGAFKEFDKRAYEKDAFMLRGKEQLNLLIEEEQVDYAFQPIVDARTGEVFGYEALMRPRVEELTSPAEVMRLATAQSRLPDIEKLTMEQGIKQYAIRRGEFKGARLFLNSIPNQPAPEGIKEMLGRYGIRPYTIVIELMESEQADLEILEEKIQLLKTFKMELALDDFGAGYNSESTLLYMDPKYIKIDMSIVRNIDKDADRQMLVANTINYVRPRGIRVIAEGVETKEEMGVLIGLGVDYLQGFYVGKPQLEVYGIDEKVLEEIQKYHGEGEGYEQYELLL